MLEWVCVNTSGELEVWTCHNAIFFGYDWFIETEDLVYGPMCTTPEQEDREVLSDL